MAPYTNQKKPLPKEIVKQKLKERKTLSKQLLKEKRARLLVKNLPFKVTEEKLREYFGQYGEISSIDILKKPDGKLLGCGFIQFKLVQKAAKARYHTNGKEFLGRVIQVDFAKPKNKFTKETVNPVKTEEQDVEDKVTVVEDIKTEDENSTEEQDGSEISDEDSESGQENVTTTADFELKNEENNPHFSHDVSEGKTVFVKNIPFDATNDDLKNCMSQFGRIYYALICIDKFTEHSKGTGFVKFVNVEDAENALKAGTELTLLGSILDCQPAIDRKDLLNKKSDKEALRKQPKDSRNLYLTKEGVISPGSSAAEGVSQSDMIKRAQIEQYKTQMLRKLNMFVSKDRLVIHNLPPSWDDNKLKALVQKFGGPGAVIKESRIMRDRRNVGADGVGISKQYGFVSFTKHENALTALRNLNNNPNVFSSNKRPIVVFSIENKLAIQARHKRLQKSRVQNQEKQENKATEGQKLAKKESKSKKFRKFLEKKKKIPKKAVEVPNEDNVPKFAGIRMYKNSR